MRLSKQQAAKNRQDIIDAAARLFRERGIDGVGVADLMKAAGFTHGGFYNHFESKEALAAEACAAAFEGAIAAMTKLLGKTESGFRKYIDKYLSQAHRDEPDGGCPTASLAADAWRQGDEFQAAYTEGIRGFLAIFEEQLAKTTGKKASASARERALRTLNEMVGALVLSRAVAGADAALSEEILRASREKLRGGE